MSAPATPPGPRLKAEREHRGLSAQKAADELHLDRWVIDALESGDYKRIGPTVYAKGHLKKYAALLGLPAAEIVAGYESRPQGPSEPTSAGPSMLLATRADATGGGNLSPAQIAACLAALILLVGVLWWRPWHHRGAPAASNAAATPTAAASAAGPRDAGSESAAIPVAAASSTTRDIGAAPAAAEGADASSGLAAPASSAAASGGLDSGATAGAGRARLRLSFSADSWVDVHDASGKRTFAGNGLANSVKTIAGAAPMRVYLGFGSGVQLEINDRVVAIGPQFFAGDVARFEAGADGVLRRDSTHGAPPRGARPPD
jgi:cytoskeleton protein RodZ